ncbi:glycosyltransferase family 4 protein [Vibrio astriarenae]|uniref:glycosyltransferase family 4 protein n=1 Tax=Vibrio astriarenae TaxID=1481923 RepID=UPI003734DB1A
MKICHVNLASGYHGGENQTLQLIQHQVKLGYELTVVANPKSPFFDAMKQLNVTLIQASHFTKAHARSITQDCSLVHVHEGRAIYWALIQSLLYDVPYIVTRRIDNKLKKKWLANLAYSKASAVIGLSTEIVNRIEDAYPDLTVFKIPSSPVTYPSNSDVVAQLHQRFQDKFVVIHAANMVSHKGFDITIEAAKLLEITNSSIHICLLGDGPERADLEVRAHGLSNLSFEGKQSNMGDWFRVANLQIHPSYSEGLGSVILEGASAGLPIVASDTGGIPDIIEQGYNGLLVKPGSPQELAQAIASLEQEPALRETFISNGQEKLKMFDINFTAQQYAKVYEQVTK